MHSDPPSALLDRVRKLLAKAEAEGVTPPEAEAFTAKAAELMARYGIDRARLAATRPDTDRPGSRIIDIANPWAQVRAHLLAGLAGAMRCQCVLLSTPAPGARSLRHSGGGPKRISSSRRSFRAACRKRPGSTRSRSARTPCS